MSVVVGESKVTFRNDIHTDDNLIVVIAIFESRYITYYASRWNAYMYQIHIGFNNSVCT